MDDMIILTNNSVVNTKYKCVNHAEGKFSYEIKRENAQFAVSREHLATDVDFH